jgi:trans-AT polyketide synthase, acyltransferase and oxidoreductase domains
LQIGSINKIPAWWLNGSRPTDVGLEAVKQAIFRLNRSFFLLDMDGRLAVGYDGVMSFAPDGLENKNALPVLSYAPAIHPKNLGDPLFKQRHNLTYAYVAGAMANGITSVEMVQAASNAGMLGVFGAAGLSLSQVEDAILRLQHLLENRPYGFNLIHSPADPEHEMAVVRLYLKHGIRLISASAYLNLTLPLIYYRVKGIYRDQQGNIICPNKVIGKVSRVEVARKFMSPPPEKILGQLLERKMITPQEASLAAHVPVADDITAEADSGGHTDNQPAISLLPTMLALRDQMVPKFNYQNTICVGLAGGIATPASAAAAFAMGAAYVLTGSVNQSCVEAGTSETVRCMLAETCQADVIMAPAADMFEMGIKVQVLKRGTMFAFRAAKLYELYSAYDCIEDIPQKQKDMLERDYFKCGFQQTWEQTKEFFEKQDPRQILIAEKDPKHKMALIFRSYLGQASKWAVTGERDRKIDYQIWCGPSMGAFNEWVRGSFLEKPENRKTATVAMNLLFGAALATRVSWLRCQGVPLPADAGNFSPLTDNNISKLLSE